MQQKPVMKLHLILATPKFNIGNFKVGVVSISHSLLNPNRGRPICKPDFSVANNHVFGG